VKNTPAVRKGQGAEQLSKSNFEARFRERFFDPAFDSHQAAIQELIEVEWAASKAAVDQAQQGA
jgi:hypothetical protein